METGCPRSVPQQDCPISAVSVTVLVMSVIRTLPLTVHSQVMRISEFFILKHPFAGIGLILVALLAPFADQAIQTDDALFIWAGQWILKHPFDFYGGTANWYGSNVPMWQVNLNPPLMPYLLAATAFVSGWNEIPLHLACIIVAIVAGMGIYVLARMWCRRPFLATIIAIVTPAFLVSATTLMCDLLMLTFWVWAIVCWGQASREESGNWKYVAAGVLAGLAILTKYSAIQLPPLLAVLSLVHLKTWTRSPGKIGWQIAGLTAPVAMVACYEYVTAQLYGRGLLVEAARQVQSFRFAYPGGWTAKGIIGLTFAGGSMLPVLFFGPWLWPWRTWLASVAVISAGILGAFWLGPDPGLIHAWTNPGIWNDWVFQLQVALFLLAGLHLLLLTVTEFWQQWDAISLFLLVWIGCFFIFAGVLNWTVNARSFLPAVPAVAILTVRRLDRPAAPGLSPAPFWAPILPAVAIALSLVIANYKTANLERTIAKQIAGSGQSPGHQLWINGHGGAQYYLQRLGAKSFDNQNYVLQSGDSVAVLWNSGTIVTLPEGSVGLISTTVRDSGAWLTLSGTTRHGLAGFFDADWGPIPFTIGSSKSRDLIVRLLTTVHHSASSTNDAALDLPWLAKPNTAAATNASRKVLLGEHLQDGGKIVGAVECYRKALSADPDDVDALAHLATLLSTASEPASRDEAVRLATKAATLTRWSQPVIAEIVSSALAADNQFADAVTTAEAAQELAALTGHPDIAAQAAKLKVAYSSGKVIIPLYRSTDSPRVKP
jgi:4-amino-4-deoxy-L-arabinose transferase-like glycosyltransferase